MTARYLGKVHVREVLGQCSYLSVNDRRLHFGLGSAATVDPRDASAQARLGAEYLHRGQPHAAVSHLQQAIAVDPTDQTALFNLQRSLHQDGREAEARTVSKRLAEIIARMDEQMQDHLTANRLNNEGVKLQQAGDRKAVWDDAIRQSPPGSWTEPAPPAHP